MAAAHDCEEDEDGASAIMPPKQQKHNLQVHAAEIVNVFSLLLLILLLNFVYKQC